jgi:hypothetical protein
LRHWTRCRGVFDFLDHGVRGAGDTGTDRGGPCRQHEAAGAVGPNAEFLRHAKRALRRGQNSLAVANELRVHGDIVQCMGKAEGMVEPFGQIKCSRGSRFGRAAVAGLL